MNCEQIQHKLLEYEQGELPPDLAAHLETCPACSEYRRQTQSLRNLLALKQFEKPNPLFAQHLPGRVIRRIEEENLQPAGGGLLFWAAAPGVKLALAAAALLVICLGVYLAWPGGGTIAPGQPGATIANASTNATVDTEPQLAGPTNALPQQIQYGPGNSRLVDYEY